MKRLSVMLFGVLMIASVFALPFMIGNVGGLHKLRLPDIPMRHTEGIILHIGDSVPLVSGYELELVDVGVSESYMGHDMHAALMEIKNSEGHVITQLHMFPGETSTFVVVDDDGEHVAQIRVLRTTYGYELFQRWAEVEVS